MIKAIWGKTMAEASEIAKILSINFFTNKIDDVLLRKDVDLIFILCELNKLVLFNIIIKLFEFLHRSSLFTQPNFGKSIGNRQTCSV